MKRSKKHIPYLFLAVLLFASCVLGSMHVAYGADMLSSRAATGPSASRQTTDVASAIRTANRSLTARNGSSMPASVTSPATAEVYASAETREGKLPASFDIYAHLVEARKTLYVFQNLTCRNNTGTPLEHICFRLPQVAQQDTCTVTMEKIQVGGAGVRIQQSEKNICSVNLPTALPQGGSVNMRIMYRLRATNLRDFFTDDASASFLRDFLAMPVAYEEEAPYSQGYSLPAPFAPEAQTIRSSQWIPEDAI